MRQTTTEEKKKKNKKCFNILNTFSVTVNISCLALVRVANPAYYKETMKTFLRMIKKCSMLENRPRLLFLIINRRRRWARARVVPCAAEKSLLKYEKLFVVSRVGWWWCRCCCPCQRRVCLSVLLLKGAVNQQKFKQPSDTVWNIHQTPHENNRRGRKRMRDDVQSNIFLFPRNCVEIDSPSSFFHPLKWLHTRLPSPDRVIFRKSFYINNPPSHDPVFFHPHSLTHAQTHPHEGR